MIAINRVDSSLGSNKAIFIVLVGFELVGDNFFFLLIQSLLCDNKPLNDDLDTSLVASKI